jgi:hypothetical protein
LFRVFPDKKTGVCTDWHSARRRYFCTGHHKNRITTFDCPPLPPTFFSQNPFLPDPNPHLKLPQRYHSARQQLPHHPSAASPFEQHTRNPAMQANKHYSFIMRPVFKGEHRALIFLAASN